MTFTPNVTLIDDMINRRVNTIDVPFIDSDYVNIDYSNQGYISKLNFNIEDIANKVVGKIELFNISIGIEHPTAQVPVLPLIDVLYQSDYFKLFI